MIASCPQQKMTSNFGAWDGVGGRGLLFTGPGNFMAHLGTHKMLGLEREREQGPGVLLFGGHRVGP